MLFNCFMFLDLKKKSPDLNICMFTVINIVVIQYCCNTILLTILSILTRHHKDVLSEQKENTFGAKSHHYFGRRAVATCRIDMPRLFPTPFSPFRLGICQAYICMPIVFYIQEMTLNIVA